MNEATDEALAKVATIDGQRKKLHKRKNDYFFILQKEIGTSLGNLIKFIHDLLTRQLWNPQTLFFCHSSETFSGIS